MAAAAGEGVGGEGVRRLPTAGAEVAAGLAAACPLAPGKSATVAATAQSETVRAAECIAATAAAVKAPAPSTTTAAEAAAWKALATARATAVAAQGEAMPTAEAAAGAAVKAATATSTAAMETAATPAMAAALETATPARVRATAATAMRPGCRWQADKDDGERRNAGHEFAAHVHVKALRSLGV